MKYTALMPISGVLSGIQSQVNGTSCAVPAVIGVSVDGQDKTRRAGSRPRNRGGKRV